MCFFLPTSTHSKNNTLQRSRQLESPLKAPKGHCVPPKHNRQYGGDKKSAMCMPAPYTIACRALCNRNLKNAKQTDSEAVGRPSAPLRKSLYDI